MLRAAALLLSQIRIRRHAKSTASLVAAGVGGILEALSVTHLQHSLASNNKSRSLRGQADNLLFKRLSTNDTYSAVQQLVWPERRRDESDALNESHEASTQQAVHATHKQLAY